MEQFPVVLRGYDKDRVDAAFAQAQKTLADMREQIASNDDMILQLQAQLEQEKSRQDKSGNSFSSLGANAQQMLSSAEQTSAELLERAKSDAASTRSAAQVQAQTLINNAKLDAKRIVADANAKADSILTQVGQGGRGASAFRNDEERHRTAPDRRIGTAQRPRGAEEEARLRTIHAGT